MSRGAVNKRDRINDFMPVSLLNSGFKILTKGLATKLTLVIGDLVGEAQSCATPKRSMQNNTYLMQSIIEKVT